MYNIYFENRRMSVCSYPEQPVNDPEAVLYSPGSYPDLANIPELFHSTPNIHKLFIPSTHEEATFKQLCTGLWKITAGGGLVSNTKGEFLMIFRYGRWDLPKGTQEPNEDIRAAALREVEEECGIGELEIMEHICDTYHTFYRNNRFNLKFTKWYRMEYKGNGFETRPQTEESIEKAVWVPKEELRSYLSNTYPSILEVFEKSGVFTR